MLNKLPKTQLGLIVVRLIMVRLILIWRTHPAATGHALTLRSAPVRG